MEEQSLRPSKQFIVRGSIAIGIVAIILIVQTDWFRSLFHKKPLSKITATTTIGDIATQDTNGNGIADWEEKLWGLDPKVLYTNGVSNKQIIEDKKRALGISDIDTQQPANDTDKLARELYVMTLALGQSDEIDQQTLAEIAAKIGASVDTKQSTVQYSVKDLRAVLTTSASLRTYYSAMTNLVEKYADKTSEMDILTAVLDTGDTTRLAELSQNALVYAQYAKDIKNVSVPVGIELEHLKLLNAIAGIGATLPSLTELGDNAIASVVGIALFRQYSLQLDAATTAIGDYLTKYGILE